MNRDFDPEIQLILEDHYLKAEQTYNKYQDALKQVAMHQIEKTWNGPKKTQSGNTKLKSSVNPSKNVIGKTIRITAKILKAFYRCGQDVIHAFHDEGSENIEELPNREITYPLTPVEY